MVIKRLLTRLFDSSVAASYLFVCAMLTSIALWFIAPHVVVSPAQIDDKYIVYWHTAIWALWLIAGSWFVIVRPRLAKLSTKQKAVLCSGLIAISAAPMIMELILVLGYLAKFVFRLNLDAIQLLSEPGVFSVLPVLPLWAYNMASVSYLLKDKAVKLLVLRRFDFDSSNA